MNLTKDYQLPKELEGKSREEMIKYYSKIPKEKKKNIALSLQAIEIRDKSLISDFKNALLCTLPVLTRRK